ncbi:valine--tRNA ligase [Lutimonas vermicola]|uniref:Valine--tRNA ligase n=1 Tax=Lutimonas vermicola TaxID=414288 RepID=A0ABU9KVZ1_9FLAO
MNIPAKYNAITVEEKWYSYWMENNYFHSEPDEREAYTIVIPPPNVTGVLHMGHMLNNTIQDVLIRRKRMQGYNACWVPGTDHASIATEAKVVAKLKEQGIKKSDLTREQFIEHAWEWTHKHGGLILEQLKKLGASCDWDRTKFTMDEDLNRSVVKIFKDLHAKGLIYKGYRMVNWDPEAKTTLSDEEVIYMEKPGKLYYLNYAIEGSDDFVQIATTRPETILGDTAICVHPEDKRFTHLKGKKAIVPIVGRAIPIIEDPYVDMEFGTGSLKITPAHDPNDKLIGEKHQLEVIDIFNDDATLNAYGLHYEGKDRFVVRKEIVAELKDKGILVKSEDYTHKVGTSERTKAVIEPKISEQWFLKMEDLVKPAIDAVLNTGEVQLVPHKFVNTYRHWMENIRDWNISRQLYWGHRIPAYYYGQGTNDYVVAETKEEALVLARQKTGQDDLNEKDIRQDEDSLDTWFSSWLWPISVFDGINDPENKDFKYYYPTNDLVTGPDILFFWVARMIIAGYEFTGDKPFHHVYLTGLVRDKQRRKMSKSLGNSPDPIELMNTYGADGVRAGILMSSAAGNDLLFDENLMLQGRNFANKIWNGFRLVKGWEVSEDSEQPKSAKVAIAWYRAQFEKTLAFTEEQFEQYRLSDALTAIYKLVWEDFSSWFLEMVKPEFGQPIDKNTYEATVGFFENNIKILHPFMPFITEEIWQYFNERSPEEALIISAYPKTKGFDELILEEFEMIKEVISAVRNLRKEKNISFKESLELYFVKKEEINPDFFDLIGKMCNVSKVEEVKQKLENALTFRVGSNEFFIPFSQKIDVEAETVKLQEELAYHKGFLASVQKKLSNERFVNNAPEQVILNERKKEADALAKIAMVEKSLASF